MLAANIKAVLDVLLGISQSDSDRVQIDAHALEFSEPLPLCVLAVELNRLSRFGKTAVVEGLRPEVAERLRRMNVLGDWLEERSRVRPRNPSMYGLEVCWINSQDAADEAANSLADAIIRFVPADYGRARAEMEKDQVRTPLAYIITELLDNALSHGRGRGFTHSSVWIAAQYYREGDLIRLAVVDDGCGIYRSLESHPQVMPKTHAVAIKKAFEPGISCNREVGLLKDALNAGMGLTFSRDIALRSGGWVAAGSGDAWIKNPGAATETAAKLPLWQGSMLNLELHRAGLISFNFRDIFAQYERPDASAKIRFLYS
jgi:hypothetical protein